MNKTIILAYFFCELIMFLTIAYAVFGLDRSGWWFLLLIAISPSISFKEKKS